MVAQAKQAEQSEAEIMIFFKHIISKLLEVIRRSFVNQNKLLRQGYC